MAAVEVMDGEVVRDWLRLAADALGQTRSAIDALNVFPVPDADTGTNLYRTMACAADAVAELPPRAGPAEVWRAAVGAALHGACGNSGIIVSQLLRGLADICGPASPCDGRVLAMALTNAAALARAAVHRPAEGTVLTVADAAARAAGRMTSLTEVIRAAAAGARLALARTEQQLDVLAASGVVDAGAAGLCVLLDALSAAISGTAPGSYAVPAPAGGRGVSAAGLAAAALAAAGASASPFAYEVMFGLEAPERQVRELRDRLDQLGDSLVVSGGDPQWHVHVHVADAGAVIETGLAAGRLSRITVTYLHGPGAGSESAEASHGPAGAASNPGWLAGPASPGGSGHRVVMIAEGAGLIRLLRDAGAIVARGQDGPAADSRVADAIGSPGAKIIIMLNKSLVPAAGRPAGPSAAGGSAPGRPAPGRAAAGGSAPARPAPGRAAAGESAPGRAAAGGRPPAEWLVAAELVVEIGSPVQALAAMAVHDPQRDLSDDAAAMRRAVAGMRHASVSLDPGSAEAAAGPAGQPPGATLAGRIADEVVVRGAGQAAVAMAVIDRLLAPGAELVTLLSGQAADPGLIELAAAHAGRVIPAAEVTCYDGGMASAVLLIGAE